MGLRNAARGLGAALTYIGQQGIEQQQRDQADARLLAREQAMARLGQQITNENADIDAKRDLGTNAARDDQLLARRKGELAVEEPIHVAAEGRAEARTRRGEAEQHRYRMAEMSAREQLDFDTWRRQHEITERDQQTYDLWRQEHGIGQPAERYLRDAGTGHYIAEDRNGVQRDTGIAFPTSNGDDLGLDEDTPPTSGAPATGRGGRPTLSPRPAPRQDNDQPPVAGARRAPDGKWYVQRNNRWFRVDS